MHIEKRATNKVGIVILVIAVIGLLAGGGYYLIKHKGQIDLNITLPWQKNETTEVDIANNKDGKKGNENRSFIAPSSISRTELEIDTCPTVFHSFEDKPKEFIIKFTTTNNNKRRTIPCEIDFYKIAFDGYLIPGSAKIRLEGETKSEEGKFVIKKSDLEANELYGIKELRVFYKTTDLRDNRETLGVRNIAFTNNRTINNENRGVLIAEFNSINVYYYKTITDNDNNYIYFIIDNKNNTQNAKIRIKKLLVNDILIDTKDFEKEVLLQTKTMVYVEVPKKIVPVISKFNISFFSIMKNNEGNDEIYISGEYSRDI